MFPLPNPTKHFLLLICTDSYPIMCSNFSNMQIFLLYLLDPHFLYLLDLHFLFVILTAGNQLVNLHDNRHDNLPDVLHEFLPNNQRGNLLNSLHLNQRNSQEIDHHHSLQEYLPVNRQGEWSFFSSFFFLSVDGFL